MQYLVSSLSMVVTQFVTEQMRYFRQERQW